MNGGKVCTPAPNGRAPPRSGGSPKAAGAQTTRHKALDPRQNPGGSILNNREPCAPVVQSLTCEAPSVIRPRPNRTSATLIGGAGSGHAPGGGQCRWCTCRRASEKLHMAKMKTNRAAAKRFKLTGKGRVRRPKAGGQHLLGGKSRKLRRRRRNNAIVSPALEKRVRNMLPYG